LPRWIRSPKAVKYALQLLLGHSNPTVSNANSNRLRILGNFNNYRLRFTMFNSIRQEVSQQALDSLCIKFSIN
jgi:hypothetical protein